MTNAILTGILATSVLVTNHASINTPKYSFNQVLRRDTYADYTVEMGDYLSAIAGRVYGSEDYWTNIWNDNPDIQDPNQLEVGTIIKIRNQKTEIPEALSPELSDRANQIDGTSLPLYSYSVYNGASVSNAGIQIYQTSPSGSLSTQNAADAPKTLTDDQITYLGNCEAGMNPARNSGNGYYGAFQFSYGTWKSMGTGYERADLAPIEVQKAAVQRLVARSSVFSQFPECSRRMRGAGVI